VKDRDYITCRELIDFIADYLDGTLAPEALREFDRHLAVCPSCVAYLESYRQTIRLGKMAASADDDAAPSIPEELVRAIRAARGKR
jgi:anti-sigma factor RsiW